MDPGSHHTKIEQIHLPKPYWLRIFFCIILTSLPLYIRSDVCSHRSTHDCEIHPSGSKVLNLSTPGTQAPLAADATALTQHRSRHNKCPRVASAAISAATIAAATQHWSKHNTCPRITSSTISSTAVAEVAAFRSAAPPALGTQHRHYQTSIDTRAIHTDSMCPQTWHQHCLFYTDVRGVNIDSRYSHRFWSGGFGKSDACPPPADLH